MAIARFPSVVIDCPDPGALARFYGAMLDWTVNLSSDWAEVRADDGHCISFQQVQDHTPPAWPTQDIPQQMHLDVIVDDLDAAEAAVLALGRDEARAPAPVRRFGCSSIRRDIRSVCVWTDPATRFTPNAGLIALTAGAWPGAHGRSGHAAPEVPDREGDGGQHERAADGEAATWVDGLGVALHEGSGRVDGVA